MCLFTKCFIHKKLNNITFQSVALLEYAKESFWHQTLFEMEEISDTQSLLTPYRATSNGEGTFLNSVDEEYQGSPEPRTLYLGSHMFWRVENRCVLKLLTITFYSFCQKHLAELPRNNKQNSCMFKFPTEVLIVDW